METDAAQFDPVPLGGRRMHQTREPSERNAERAAIAKVDPHRMLVKTDGGR